MSVSQFQKKMNDIYFVNEFITGIFLRLTVKHIYSKLF